MLRAIRARYKPGYTVHTSSLDRNMRFVSFGQSPRPSTRCRVCLLSESAAVRVRQERVIRGRLPAP